MNLGGTLQALGDVAAARSLFEKVVDVRARTLPDHHPDLQGARGNLAAAMRQQGDLVSARALEEETLEAFSGTHPDDHVDLSLLAVDDALLIAEAVRGTLPAGTFVGIGGKWFGYGQRYSRAVRTGMPAFVATIELAIEELLSVAR